MSSETPPGDGAPLTLRTQPIAERVSKVRLAHLAPPAVPLPGFLERLPDQLAGRDLRTLVQAMAAAHRAGRRVAVTMGAHVVKCGLSPVLIDLMERGIVTSFATNGAAIIHDCELALFGRTSEDVEQGLRDGTFGMAEETHRFVNGAVNAGVARGLGIGRAVGEALLAEGPPHAEVSLFAAAARLDLPATVHVAIGTDIVHMHPTASGAALGEGSLRDFYFLTRALQDLAGGVLLNLGSAVLMPEVVLKGMAILANRGVRLDGCLSADLDMARSYRGSKQIVERIAALGGRGLALVGHHEIMIPLLAGLLLAELERPASR
jgi:hypothetical protein